MDAYETRKKEWEDLEVTKDELKCITDCLKKEDFRKLLIEYAEEVTDPENRKVYEKEITQLEKERGVDVTFVNPEPGYVIKTSVNGEKKCFLNIGKSDVVARPTSQPSLEQGHRGLQWSIPYTLIPPRDDLDKKHVRCMVFDVVFHPDTIYLTSKNSRFREMVNNTAMDGVENNFKVKLDRKNIKFPKMNYKGICQPSVIRKPMLEPPKEKLDIEPEIYQKLMSSYDESRAQQKKQPEKKAKRPQPPSTYYSEKIAKAEDTTSKYVAPKFSIKHQSDIDLQDFGLDKHAKAHAAIPKKLVIIVDLPLLKGASDALLDIQERFLSLKSEKPAKYLLELPLPYQVDPDSGNAKFDSKYKKLTVTLPVIKPAIPTDTREDSGVDSDHESPTPLMFQDSTEDSLIRCMPKLVEECETMLAATELEKGSKELEECSDTQFRTSSAAQETDTFMNPNIKYSMPAFNCNIYDNQLAITVNVKNVDPDSIRHRILRNKLGLHVLLVSIGTGFFPQYYSLCLKIAEDSIDSDSLTIEPWDNNVVFTVTLRNAENLARYYVGLIDEFMEERNFPTAASFKNQLKELASIEDTETRNESNIENTERNGVIVNIRSNQLDSDDDAEQDPKVTIRRQNRRHASSKSRSVSESSGDEIASNISSGNSVGFSKGILKLRRTHDFSRSVSESSADENGMPTSSVDWQYDSVQDLNSESDCSSLKKTVRFNDVVSRQLFRSNSSILGQRRKNQRKLRNKKRAHERRMSESENSETDERDKYKANQKSLSDQEISENVKPILNRYKQIEQQRTANIEIEKTRNGDNLSLHKRKCPIVEKVGNDVCIENPIEIAKDVAKTEFKNDLIFDLDM